jgi:hypothetical protein
MHPDDIPAARADATIAGAAAFAAGNPCTAPDYGRRDLEALWRIAWRRAAAAAGVVTNSTSPPDL